jgi:hypothetical protein
MSVTHLLVKQSHFFIAGSERRQNNNVSVLDCIKVLCIVAQLFNELHIHLVKAVVHFRIMNEFVGDVNGPIRKVIDGLIRKRNTSLNTPAETKVLTKEELTKNERG